MDSIPNFTDKNHFIAIFFDFFSWIFSIIFALGFLFFSLNLFTFLILVLWIAHNFIQKMAN